MQSMDVIEALVTREIKGLCVACQHAQECTYHHATTKAIIQCELFEFSDEQRSASPTLCGLCKTCDNASTCNLPGRISGVWHCNQFT